MELSRLRVDALSTDGRGLCRAEDGRVVFVPGAWIGEEIEITPPEKRGNVFVARLLRVLEPAPSRREPPCPYYGRCGGCQVQHVDEGAQRAARVDALFHNLRRLGKWDEARLARAKERLVVHEAEAWNYRQRVRWHVEAGPDGKARAGFRAAGSHDLVAIERCPISKGALATSAAAAIDARFGNAVSTQGSSIEVEATLDADGAVHLRPLDARRGSADKASRGPIRPVRAERGRLLPIPHPRLSPFLVHEESFVQPHARALFLYAGVIEEAIGRFVQEEAEALGPVVDVWDLYCGSGAFSFLPFFLDDGARAGKGFRVTGVEGVERAVESARRNYAGARARFSPGAEAGFEAVRDDVRRFVARGGQQRSGQLGGKAHLFPSIVLTDPPRDGMGLDAMRALVPPHCQPALLIYIACDSASLARDLGPALEAGYTLDALHLFDTFAQTAHFESLAVLRLRT